MEEEAGRFSSALSTPPLHVLPACIELDIRHARIVRALTKHVAEEGDVGLRILSVLAVEVRQSRGAIGVLGNARGLSKQRFCLGDSADTRVKLVKLAGVHLDARGRVDAGREQAGNQQSENDLPHGVPLSCWELMRLMSRRRRNNIDQPFL